MKRFVEGQDRAQVTLLPECLDDYVAEDNPVQVIDVFIDELDLTGIGFEGVAPADTGRPAYHPAVLLKIYVETVVTDRIRGHVSTSSHWRGFRGLSRC